MYKKISKRIVAHKWIILVTCILCAAIATLFYLRPTEPDEVKRFVTFYDRGIKRSIVVRASTVGEALKKADISVDARDVVEPTADTKFTSQYEDVIIYRSRLVAINDGTARQTILTVAQSPNQILEAAKLTSLGKEDRAVISQSNFVTEGASTKLVVTRAEIKKKVVVPPKVVFGPGPNALTPSRGAQVFVDDNGVAHRETYYDLVMDVVIGACGGSKYTVRYDGAKIDAEGYVLVAANYTSYPRCSVVQTSLGPGKVYDTGGFAVRHPYGFDLATDWSDRNGR